MNFNLNGLVKKQLGQHISKRHKAIKFIVVHDTANSSKGAGANAHFNYFNTTSRKASADFLVENDTVLQINDFKKFFTWHCGDGRSRFGISNSNSVGIEMCINSDSNRQRTKNATIRLIYALMCYLDIPIKNVVRHWDASRKTCPGSMSKNNWEEWYKFKDALEEYAKEREDKTNYIVVNFNGSKKLVEGFHRDDINFVKIRDIVEMLGYQIDGRGNEVTIYQK